MLLLLDARRAMEQINLVQYHRSHRMQKSCLSCRGSSASGGTTTQRALMRVSTHGGRQCSERSSRGAYAQLGNQAVVEIIYERFSRRHVDRGHRSRRQGENCQRLKSMEAPFSFRGEGVAEEMEIGPSGDFVVAAV